MNDHLLAGRPRQLLPHSSCLSSGLLACALLASTLLLASPSGAEQPSASNAPSKQQCARSYESAQEHRATGALTQTRTELLTCSNKMCPSFVQQDCKRWLSEVEREVPSFLLFPVDKDLVPVSDLTLLLDGQTVLAGSAVALDPGRHKLEVVHNGQPIVTRSLLAQQGVQEREIQIVLPPLPAGVLATDGDAMVDSTTPSFAPYAYAAWGVGAVGFGVFGVLGHMGRTDENSLRADCSEATEDCGLESFNQRKDDYRQLQLFADVGLVTGIVGALSGAALYWLSSSGGEDSGSELKVDVSATGAGSFVHLRGQF